MKLRYPIAAATAFFALSIYLVPTPAQPVAPPFDYARAEHSVVVLEDGAAGSGSGATGTFIGRTFILTAKHVVHGVAKVIATDYEGRVFDTVTVWESPTQDLAVLYAAPPAGTRSEPISCGLPAVSDAFTMLGHPNLNPRWVFAWGRFTSDRRFDAGRADLGSVLVGESAGTHGDSGAPIFNERHEIVGVLSGGFQGTGVVLVTPVADSCELVKAAIGQ